MDKSLTHAENPEKKPCSMLELGNANRKCEVLLIALSVNDLITDFKLLSSVYPKSFLFKLGLYFLKAIESL